MRARVLPAQWPNLVHLSFPVDSLSCFSHPEAVVCIDFWKPRCQLLPKNENKIAKVTLGSLSPRKVSVQEF